MTDISYQRRAHFQRRRAMWRLRIAQVGFILVGAAVLVGLLGGYDHAVFTALSKVGAVIGLVGVVGAMVASRRVRIIDELEHARTTAPDARLT